MISKNELNIKEGLNRISNLSKNHLRTFCENSGHETKRIIRNEAGERIYNDVIVKNTSKNKRYEVRVKVGEEKHNDLVIDNLPADFISGDKYLGGVV
jgi:hypothetical protein